MPYTRRKSYVRRRTVRKGRRPSLHPVKRYIGKRRNIKFGNLWRDVKMLKGLINTEIKYVDRYGQNNATENYYQIVAAAVKSTEGNATVAGTPGYISQNIPYVDQGDDFDQRNGRSIKLKSLQVKGTLCLDVDAATSSATFTQKMGEYRLMVIVDHQSQEGEITDLVPILYEVDQNGEYSMNSRVNRQQNKRYSVLMSRKIALTENRPKRDFNLYVRLSDKIKFNGVLASDFMDKSFHFVILPAASWLTSEQQFTTQALMQYETRFTYVDN